MSKTTSLKATKRAAHKAGKATVTKAAKAAPAKAPSKIDKAAKIHVVVANARKAGTAGATSFDIYKNGMTVAEYLEFEGAGLSHLRWDVDHGFIKLT